MSLANGILKLQPKGGQGHHNGYAHVSVMFDTRETFFHILYFIALILYNEAIFSSYSVLCLVINI